MNKQEYLRLIKQQMSQMDTDASLQIMTQIIRTFEEETAKGYSEREIIEQLGNPSKLVSNYQYTPSDNNSSKVLTEEEVNAEVIEEKTLMTDEEEIANLPLTDDIGMDVPHEPTQVSENTGNSGSIVRFLLGLMIGLPILLALFSIALAGIAVAAFAFLQGLIMTFDLPYQIWQFPFTIREDFSLLVGIGLIMVGSGLITLFISALVGIYHGLKNLIKGNFGLLQ
jgi:hypothetical protein